MAPRLTTKRLSFIGDLITSSRMRPNEMFAGQLPPRLSMPAMPVRNPCATHRSRSHDPAGGMDQFDVSTTAARFAGTSRSGTRIRALRMLIVSVTRRVTSAWRSLKQSFVLCRSLGPAARTGYRSREVGLGPGGERSRDFALLFCSGERTGKVLGIVRGFVGGAHCAGLLGFFISVVSRSRGCVGGLGWL